MKHYIIAKFKPEITREQQTEMLPDISELFGHLIWMKGIRNVDVCLNCVDRDNRYDVMIEIEMEKEALESYDNCIWHKIWKEKYGKLLEKKTIFDRE